jgi:hypothetical protein
MRTKAWARVKLNKLDRQAILRNGKVELDRQSSNGI